MGQQNVLIVGCGAIAGGYDASRPDDAPPRTHAAAYRQAGGFNLVACVDPDEGRRAGFQKRWGVSHAVGSMAEAAEFAPYDIVSLCSPTALHAPHFHAALALRPRLIFAEKPLTPDIAASRSLISAAADAGVAVAVNHTRRWAPDVRQLCDEIAAGRWGAVRSASGVYTKGVLNNGSHMFDLLAMLLGPLSVVSAGRPVFDHWPDDPSIPCLLAAGDVPVTLNIGNAADFSLFELELATEAGVVRMEEGGLSWRRRLAVDSPHFVGYRTLGADSVTPGRYDLAMLACMNQLRSHLETGGPLSCDGGSALAAQAIAHEVRVAAGVHFHSGTISGVADA